MYATISCSRALVLIVNHEVQHVVFRVHEYLFTRESTQGKILVQESKAAPSGILVLEDTTPAAVESFLKVLYCR
jgi:hypothetical protein